MKLFSCTNKQCKSNIPNDAQTNKIAERIISEHALNEHGDVNEKIEPDVITVEYICKRCDSKAIEVPHSMVMKARINKITNKNIYGEYKNRLRGKNKTFEFILEKRTGEVRFENLNSRKVEDDFIRDYYKFFYKTSILTEISDVISENGNKKYEVMIKNKDEDIDICAYIENDEIIDWDGDRPPNEFEMNKALEVVKHSPY